MKARHIGLVIVAAAIIVGAITASNLAAHTIVAGPGMIGERVAATAIAVPKDGFAHLRATIAATAKQVLVKEGDSVQTGQLLATLDAPVLALELAQRQAEVRARAASLGLSRTTGIIDQARAGATANADQLQASVIEDRARRQQELERLGSGSSALAEQLRLEAEVARARAQASLSGHLEERGRSEIRIARENLRAADAEVQAATFALRQTQIVSPVDGVVVTRSVDPGDAVLQNATLFEIADPKRLELRAEVDGVVDLRRVRPGLSVSVFGTQGAAQVATGHVRRVGVSVERRPNSAGVATEVGIRPIWIDLEESPETELVLGRRYEVTIDVALRPAPLVVPKSTIRVRDGVSQIAVKGWLWFRDVPVEVVRVDGDVAEIRGIDQGSLQRGALVRIN